MNPIDYLRLGVEQYLRELPDDEFNDLVQRVCPPDARREPSESGRAAFARNLFGGGDD
ncbi:hypothetical protein [Mycolicibacterium sp. F2034L]|uniref:hypothetical protein n=1 Tax=Mycolicibacterium sp. F2034L TaxID=2926422 RepID=UPI001FF5591A|nr:hypothetical protein [Mycolicibacterium sp. F2034L]MCK0175841.1 hypothetical protein [Mycolicibacterium sp. F2034L]